MPREETLAQPLSGAEIIEAVLFQLREKLERDCYLSPTTGYEMFSATVHIRIQAHDTGRTVEVERVAHVESDPAPDEEDQLLAEVDMTLEPQAPNEVRLSTDQPIPTLTETADGKREIKPVRYHRPLQGRAGQR